MMSDEKAKRKMMEWRQDWNVFCREVLRANLDKEQQAVLSAVQNKPMVAVASGTARGKDYVAACACLCFLFLTPTFDKNGELVGNTKVAMTAPTSRQVTDIMMPEISRLFNRAKILPGVLQANGIRTNYKEWFLKGFKSDDNNQEAWSGFHAVNTMFVVTEATGLSETVFNTIEGNLQGNSRLLLVFNPNVTTGYAARAMKSSRFVMFRLNSLYAENVVKKEVVIPGQVNYEWVKDKVENWAVPISIVEYDEGEGDFEFDNRLYRPNDLFRVKVLGMFPKVSNDILIPYEWVELANRRWQEMRDCGFVPNERKTPLRLGVDVAGMGRDASVLCPRYGGFVDELDFHQSGGTADHMHIVGMVCQYSGRKGVKVIVDTIGEGAGVYSRLVELGHGGITVSCKFSESAKRLTDETGQYTFANMRAYLYWCVRDWLNPKNGHKPALPPNNSLMEELTDIHWKFLSNGSIMIESKDDIRKRLRRSPDFLDALANTFYPCSFDGLTNDELLEILL